MILTMKTSDQSEVEKEKGRRFCELPPEIQNLISSFLFAGDSFVFRRLVSRSMMYNLSAAPSITISTIQPHHLYPELPYLLSLQEDNVFKLYHPMMSGFHRIQIPQLSEARIRCSNHGWLLMSGCNCDVFFFEPFSKVMIQLPKYNIKDSCASMCFSSPPTSPDCFVVGVQLKGKYCHIIKRGQEAWTEHSLIRNQDTFLLFQGVAPLVLNGSCYCLGDDGRLGEFNLDDQRPKWKFIGDSYREMERASLCQCFLLQRNRGELLRVSVFCEDTKFEFTNFNIRKKTSMPDKSLDKRLVFLSPGASFIESSNLRGSRNKVYFPKLHNDATLFYSISEERYLSFCDNYSNTNSSGDVKDVSLISVWIKPDRSLRGHTFKW